jgi:pimeloyl-ACP methyl ester carboxylesterase
MNLSRRSFIELLLSALAASAAGCAGHAAATRPEPPRKGPIVIVPGTGAGPAMYERLLHALQARGRDAFGVALAGMGERVAELRPEIDDNLHAQEVADFLAAHNLRDVTLVGHSYGGLPMTGAVGRAPDRIARIVYVDSYLAKNGDSLLSMDRGLVESVQKQAEAAGEAWKIPVFPGARFLKEPADIEWFDAHATASPMAMYTTPLVVDEGALAKVKKGYVAYTQFKYFQHQGEALAKTGAKYRLVQSSHMGVYLAPDATADAILAVED